MEIKGGGVLASTFFLLILGDFSNNVGAFVQTISLLLAIGNLQIYLISGKILKYISICISVSSKNIFFVFNVQIVSLEIPTLQDMKRCLVL